MSSETEQDHLEFVRERLRAMTSSELAAVAEAAGVTTRTLYYLIEKKFEGARYMTVKKIHKAITDADKIQTRRKKKTEAIK